MSEELEFDDYPPTTGSGSESNLLNDTDDDGVFIIRDLTDVSLDPNNASVPTERGMSMIESSLSECGAGRSILVDRKGRVIAGNKTTETAVGIGMEDVIVVQSDGKKLVVVQRTDLDMDTDEKAIRLALFDNKTQIHSEWSGEELQRMRQRGVSISGIFTDEEFDAIAKKRQQEREGHDENNIQRPEDNKESAAEVVFMVVVQCADGQSQKELYEEMKERGLTVHVYDNQAEERGKKGRNRKN